LIVAEGLDRNGLVELLALGYVEQFDIGINGRWRLTKAGMDAASAAAASTADPRVSSRRRRER
jgi:hypothetical protein